MLFALETAPFYNGYIIVAYAPAELRLNRVGDRDEWKQDVLVDLRIDVEHLARLMARCIGCMVVGPTSYYDRTGSKEFDDACRNTYAPFGESNVPTVSGDSWWARPERSDHNGEYHGRPT